MRFRKFFTAALAVVMTFTSAGVSANAFSIVEKTTSNASVYESYNNERAYYAGNVFAENGIQYSGRIDGTLEVLGAVNKQNITAADIASDVNGIKVTRIADNAFNGCENLRTVNIPDSVLEIGGAAFLGCSSLVNLNFGKSITTICAYAFYGCSALTELTLPDSLTTCEKQSFDHCVNLKTVTIPKKLTGIDNNGIFAYCSVLKEINVDAANRDYCSENGILFTKDKTCLVEYPAGKNDISYTIPASVNRLGRLAFAGCTSLENVLLPNGISEISYAAFSWCPMLKTVTIPRSITTISPYAFFSCNKLTNICFAGTTEQWSGIYIKEYNNSLDKANITCSATNITSNVTDNGVVYALKTDGTLEVLGAADKQTITAADIASEIRGVMVTSIANNAFNGCENLRTVNIPDSVSEIGSAAFLGCSSLANLNFGKSVTTIRAYAFYGCSTLTEFALPDSLTTCEKQSFDHCVNLKTVTIPKNLTGIENKGIFAYCSSLTEINVCSESTAYYSENGVLFSKDKSCLVAYPSGRTGETYTIPKTVKSIGGFAFAGSLWLKSAIVSDGVTEIGYTAFSWSSIKALNLPKSIQNISQYALFSCTKLTDIYYWGTESEWTSVYIEAYNDSINSANLHFDSIDFSGKINQNGIIYALSSDNAHLTVIGATDAQSITAAEIAAEINGVKVTSIANNAFNSCKNLHSVNIPGSISHIGGAAFLGCSSLRELTLGDGIERIDSHAFYGCSALKDLILPESVITVGQQAFDHCTGIVSVTIPKNLTGIENNGIFAYCSSLTEIKVHVENPAYCSENGILFSKDKTILVEYPIGKKDSFYAVPASVKALGNYAFAGCSALKTVIIPDGVTQISRAAFAYCTRLKSVALPSSVSKINLYAFYTCVQLSDIFFNGTENQWYSITVENNNDSLNNVVIHYGDLKPHDEIIKDGIRYVLDDNCTFYVLGSSDPDAITSAYMADEINGIKVTEIAAGAFKNCKRISSAKIPGTVEKIGHSAFLGCTSLADLTIEEGVRVIDDYVFYGCSALKNLLLPDSLTTLNRKPFDHCSGLVSVTIPKNVKNIECSGVFAYCANLTQINVDTENPYYCSVDGVLFSKDMTCLLEYPAGKKASSYTIPSCVSSFGYFAFAGCGALESIVIPDGFSEIEFAAFSWCGGLKTITIPSSVVEIKRFGFNNCNRLTDIYYAGTEEQWNSIEVDYYRQGNESNDAIYNAAVHYNSGYVYSNAIALQSYYIIGDYDTYALDEKLCA